MSWLLSLGLVSGIAIGNASMNVTAAAMLADIADYGIVKSGRNNTATYFAALSLIFKITFGVGSGLALWIVGVYGFDATASGTTLQSDTAIFGLRLAFIVLPILLDSGRDYVSCFNSDKSSSSSSYSDAGLIGVWWQ